MRRTELRGQLTAITHLASDGNYTHVHFAHQPSVLLSCSLAVCIAELPGLVRIHRQYAVNPAFVAAKTLTPNGARVVVNGINLPVSRRLVKSVIEAFTNGVSLAPIKPALPQRSYGMIHEVPESISLTWQ